MNIGAYWNQAWDALPRFQGQPEYHDSLLGMDLNFGLGLADRWDLGMSIPSVLNQNVGNQAGFSGKYTNNGLTEFKFNTKFRFIGEDDGGVAVVVSANFNRIRNNPFVGVDAGPTYNLEAVYDRTFGKIAAAVNAGYRIRNSGAPIAGVAIRPFGNQWIASLAGNYYFEEWDSKLVAEVYGSLPASSSGDNLDRQSSSLEALLGIKHDFTNNLAGHFGVGREILTGLSSPDFRVYAGLNLQFGPVFGGGTPAVVAGDQFTVRKIPFGFNSSELGPEARPILDELAAHLKKGFKSLVIAGHTDSIGNDEYNLRLSRMRAEAIRNDLIKTYRFDGARIEASGYGEGRPIADNGNYQGREANRRVEFTLKR